MRSNLESETSECTGVFKQKRRKELQEQIANLDKKAEKMKAEFSKVLQNDGYSNAAEFYTEPFMVREEKQKYEVACKEWQLMHDRCYWYNQWHLCNYIVTILHLGSGGLRLISLI